MEDQVFAQLQILKNSCDLNTYNALCRQLLSLCDHAKAAVVKPPTSLSFVKVGYRLCLRRAEIQHFVDQGHIQPIVEAWTSKYNTQFFYLTQVELLEGLLVRQASSKSEIVDFSINGTDGQQRALTALFNWHRAVMYPQCSSHGKVLSFYLQREGTNNQPIPALEKRGFVELHNGGPRLTPLGIDGGRYLANTNGAKNALTS
jgi:hypothetical protein